MRCFLGFCPTSLPRPFYLLLCAPVFVPDVIDFALVLDAGGFGAAGVAALEADVAADTSERAGPIKDVCMRFHVNDANLWNHILLFHCLNESYINVSFVEYH